MNDENMRDLARIRLERAEELLEEAKSLLESEKYKSANNRAFYSAEKSLKAALAVKGKDSSSHNGVVKTFNQEFIHSPSEFFARGDMSLIMNMERIRNASDYDDFYITGKEECKTQVENAELLLGKVKQYLESEDVLEMPVKV